ncbi:hypothetical protein [Empedobacter brevis]|uniref:hypothetical protein n=1 Tax=Empedobacter brevis TaxID=247 RepID=UPI001330640B|nr:hypothetical protein [Empedobacter brevis]
MMRYIFYCVLFLLFSSCGSSISTKLVNQNINELENKEVLVIYNKEDLPSKSVLLGRIKIGDTGFSTECSKGEVMNNAIQQVKKNNGNILLIDEIKEPSYSSSCYRLKANIYYNTTSKMKKFHQESENTFDETADYALVHILCTFIEGKAVTFDGENRLSSEHKIILGDKTIRIKENQMISIPIKKNGKLIFSSDELSKKRYLELDIEKGKEYFINASTYRHNQGAVLFNGQRFVLNKLNSTEGKNLYNNLKSIIDERKRLENE